MRRAGLCSTAAAIALLGAVAGAAPARAGVSLTTVAQTRSLTITSDILRGITTPETDEVWIGQTSIRSSLTADLTPSLSFLVSGGAGISGLDEAVGGTDLGGPTDIRAKFFYRAAGDRLLLGAGVVVPSGREAFATDEITTAQWAWNPLCGFSIKRLGEGLGGDFTAAAALPLGGPVVLGVGAGYYSRGEYDLLSEQETRYRPGAEVSATIGLDVTGESRTFRLAATYRGYSADEINGERYVDQGDQIEMGAAFVTGGARLSGSLGARAIVKSDNKRYDAADPGPPTTESGGKSYFLSARATWAASNRFYVFGDASWNKFTDFGIQTRDVNGSSITIGPGIGWRPSRGFEAAARGAYAFGGTENGLIDFAGYDVVTSVTLRR